MWLAFLIVCPKSVCIFLFVSSCFIFFTNIHVCLQLLLVFLIVFLLLFSAIYLYITVSVLYNCISNGNVQLSYYIKLVCKELLLTSQTEHHYYRQYLTFEMPTVLLIRMLQISNNFIMSTTFAALNVNAAIRTCAL